VAASEAEGEAATAELTHGQKGPVEWEILR